MTASSNICSSERSNCGAERKFSTFYDLDPDTVWCWVFGELLLGIISWAFANMPWGSSTSPSGLATIGQKEIVFVPPTGNVGGEDDGDAHSDSSSWDSENYNGGDAAPFSYSDDAGDEPEDHE